MDKAAFLDFVVEIVRRSDPKGFDILPRRWVVERTFGWMIRWRRLVRDPGGVLRMRPRIASGLVALTVLACGLLAAAPGATQAPPQRGRAARQPAVIACDLAANPWDCGSCPALAAAVRAVAEPEALSRGPSLSGVVWTPLYIAEQLNCPDVGRSLVLRGTNPNVGGPHGALLVQVARMASGDAEHPSNASGQARASAWVAVLARGMIDVDLPLPEGSTNRIAWAAQSYAASAASREVWERILGLSTATPVLASPEMQRTSPDLPAPDTGITRPSETAVSRGVEIMVATHRESGTFGLSARIQECYEKRRPPAMTRVALRWAIDQCIAMDTAGVAWSAPHFDRTRGAALRA